MHFNDSLDLILERVACQLLSEFATQLIIHALTYLLVLRLDHRQPPTQASLGHSISSCDSISDLLSLSELNLELDWHLPIDVLL